MTPSRLPPPSPPDPEPALLTPYVFIDTSVFWKANFNWTSPRFSALQRLCAAGDLKLLTTDIVRREIDAHLVAKLEVGARELAKSRKLASILLQVDPERFRPVFERVDLDASLQILRQNTDTYFEACQALMLDAYAVSSRAIFEAYFEGTAPFGAGDKKAEFPDAFNLAALSAWAETTGERAYLISDDGDLRAACEASAVFIWIDRMETVVAAAQAELDLAQEVQAASERLMPEIRNFLGVEFPKLSFVLDDQRGDVSAVRVVKADLQDVILVDRDGNWSQVEATVRVTYSGLAEFDDMATAVWDSEDKVNVPWRRVQDEILEMVEVAVELQLERRAKGLFDLVRCKIDEPKTVYVNVRSGPSRDADDRPQA